MGASVPACANTVLAAARTASWFRSASARLGLVEGGGDTERQHQEAQVLQTGLFYSAARFRIIEGSPEPAEWLEVFETDDPDPLYAYSRTVSNTPPAPQIQPELSRSFRWLAPANEGRVS